ncbi:hypothetical protein OH738_01310 [Streptomyces hirsutus]|uniref:Transposase n=1 Tax=Streptomyces hirsutus TaxID=35620 RepID=A0ABZ1H186_9ACTN|nr:hypothetical protein [Streptomyces hirsutus]WSD11029.1 hypothetical protein OIE73_38680 [Streptomyces hirsutus]WTD15625.1 hypothetical protein OH738_01310 [Streptomyces hirsutus]WTD72953.1 hypothetical protein OHB56_02595 [Streptomyces sp. NBC_01635]
MRHHINVLGRYSFQLPELPGVLRPLRDKNATDDEQDPCPKQFQRGPGRTWLA